MKYLLLILPMLMGFSNTPSECKTYTIIEPTLRENNTALLKKDIDYYVVYLDKKEANLPPLPAGTTSWTWMGSTCGQCVQVKTFLKDGQESIFSACAKSA